MYQTGDYVTPRLHGMTWFEKPVLLYWTAAVSFAVFGVTEFAARFPSALTATVSVFLHLLRLPKTLGAGRRHCGKLDPRIFGRLLCVCEGGFDGHVADGRA